MASEGRLTVVFADFTEAAQFAAALAAGQAGYNPDVLYWASKEDWRTVSSVVRVLLDGEIVTGVP